jgi:tyrosinase
MIRRNFLTDAASAGGYIGGIKILKDPVRSPWPGRDGLSIYDSFVFWHHQSMMMMTPPTQSDRNAAHSGPGFLPWHRYFLLTLESFLQQALGNTDFRVPLLGLVRRSGFAQSHHIADLGDGEPRPIHRPVLAGPAHDESDQ